MAIFSTFQYTLSIGIITFILAVKALVPGGNQRFHTVCMTIFMPLSKESNRRVVVSTALLQYSPHLITEVNCSDLEPEQK